jgi:hypothetical protein
MVDKRSLRSSKKDTQDTPAEEEKPKPTRTKSGRSTRKPASGKSQETASTSGTDDPAAPPSVQSEDVAMETESVAAEKGAEDVEMKNVEPLEEEKEDASASPLTSTFAARCPCCSCFGCRTNLCF